MAGTSRISLTSHQKKQLKGAVEFASSLKNHCVAVNDTYYWVRDVDVVPDVMGPLKSRQIRIYLRSKWIVNAYGVIFCYPKSVLTYRTLAYINGNLYQPAPGNTIEKVDVEIVDNVQETLRIQWFASCPNCGKRDRTTWIRQGYASSKEPYPRPPERSSQDRIECKNCGKGSHYREWDLEVTPRQWLFTPEKPIALKGVKKK